MIKENWKILLFLIAVIVLVNAHHVYKMYVHPELTETDTDDKIYWFIQDIGIFAVPGILCAMIWRPPTKINFRFAALTLSISFFLDVLQTCLGGNWVGWELECIGILSSNVAYWISTKKNPRYGERGLQ